MRRVATYLEERRVAWLSYFVLFCHYCKIKGSRLGQDIFELCTLEDVWRPLEDTSQLLVLLLHGPWPAPAPAARAYSAADIFSLISWCVGTVSRAARLHLLLLFLQPRPAAAAAAAISNARVAAVRAGCWL